MKIPFLLSVLGIGAQMLIATFAAEEARQYYELRVYTTQSEKQQSLINDYWEKAAVPAYHRAGIRNIGVFTEIEPSPTNRIHVLIPFETWSAFESLPTRLAGDNAYQSASAEFMNRTRNDAPYSRLDSSLLLAMTGMPRLALPPSSADKKPWIFELRTYFSPTEAKGENKIDMFNAGEVQIMKEIGLNPVFFAGSLIGPRRPNLVYMTSGPDMEQYKGTWKGFGPHPLWKKLSADPQYKDNMTGSDSVFLRRTSASEI